METPQKKIKDKKFNNTPEYNKKYYQKHKTEILSVLAKKCICELCNRQVSRSRLNRHKTTDFCMNHRPENSNESLLEQIETLTEQLNQLTPST